MAKHSQPSAKTKTPIKTKAKTPAKRRSSTESIEKKPAAVSASAAIATPQTKRAPTPGPARPGGKLGLIVDRLGDEAGMTIEELTAVTGWQAHTVRAALSRLRTRGFASHLERNGDRSAYHLVQREG